MGAVFRARSPEGQDLAIKVLVRASGDAARRFERERRLLASFGESEGFVPLLDAGVSEAGAFLVMPLVAGGAPRARLARGPLRLEETLQIRPAVPAALGDPHAHGRLHPHAKP